jgi:hypothetical protein
MTPPGMIKITWLVIFRNFFNPVDYTGSFKAEVKKHW